MPPVPIRPRNARLMAAALGCALALAPAPSAHAQQAPAAAQAGTRDLFLAAEGGWQTYVNGRFGMVLSFPPDLFTPADPPANGDGRRFLSPEAGLETFGWVNAEGETPASMKARLVGSAGYEQVTYGPVGRDWVALSGYRGGKIFYEKYIFRGDTVQAFGMEYPAPLRDRYDRVLERVEDAFRAGGG